jgi:hypothetical protein
LEKESKKLLGIGLGIGLGVALVLLINGALLLVRRWKKAIGRNEASAPSPLEDDPKYVVDNSDDDNPHAEVQGVPIHKVYVAPYEIGGSRAYAEMPTREVPAGLWHFLRYLLEYITSSYKPMVLLIGAIGQRQVHHPEARQ